MAWDFLISGFTRNSSKIRQQMIHLASEFFLMFGVLNFLITKLFKPIVILLIDQDKNVKQASFDLLIRYKRLLEGQIRLELKTMNMQDDE